MNLIVLDSSSDKHAADNAASIAELNQSDQLIQYFRYSSDIPMAEKIAQGLENVQTPYVSLCADDDIVFPDALEQAIGVLEQDTSVAAAHGIYVSFHVGKRRVLQIMREYSGPSIDAPHSGARIFRFCQLYESLFYAVCRTSNLLCVFQSVRSIETLAYQEFFQSLALLIFGKSVRLPILYAGRRSGDAAEPDREKWQTYYWFADDRADFLHHYADFQKRMVSFYGANSVDEKTLSSEDFEKALDLAFTIYFSQGCPPAYFHYRLQDLWPGNEFIEPSNHDILDALKPDAPEPIVFQPTVLQRILSRLIPEPPPRPVKVDIPLNWTMDDEHPLNHKIFETTGVEWTLRVPDSIHWIRDLPNFQAAFLELLRYLSENSKSTLIEKIKNI